MIPFTPLKYPNDYENELYKECWNSLSVQEQTQINTALESWLMSYLGNSDSGKPIHRIKKFKQERIYMKHISNEFVAFRVPSPVKERIEQVAEWGWIVRQ